MKVTNVLFAGKSENYTIYAVNGIQKGNTIIAGDKIIKVKNSEVK